MKYRLTFCILLLLFVAGSMSLIMAQTPQWITASESQSETNTWLGFKRFCGIFRTTSVEGTHRCR